MTLRPVVTYLTVDSMAEGVGWSQVLPYVERLVGCGFDVKLHSFEKSMPNSEVEHRLSGAGVGWHPHMFKGGGSAAGLGRVLLGASLIRGAELVHARSDLPAASCLLARPRAWVWDMRGLWREQRVSLGLLKSRSAQAKIMKAVESAAARSCTGLVTLTKSSLEVMVERHGPDMARKSRVIPTCVDLALFIPSPMPPPRPLRLLLAGTLNRLYDVPAMVRLFHRIQARLPAELTVLAPAGSPWRAELETAGASIASVSPLAMPVRIAEHHAGLCMLRADVGVSSLAAAPTKLGELLASGRPVVVSAGLGDMDTLLADRRCGVVVGQPSDLELDRAAQALEALVVDPSTPTRCRALAQSHFDIDTGIKDLMELYRASLRH